MKRIHSLAPQRFPSVLAWIALTAALLILAAPPLDAQTTILATVNTGATPQAIAFNPLTNTIYVANGGDGTVTVVDGATNTALATPITVGANPVALAVNSVTNTIYVVNSGSNNVSVIDGATNSVIATVFTGASPVGIAIDPVTNQIYVANTQSNFVSVISGDDNSVTPVTIGFGSSAVAVNPATNLIYITPSNGTALAMLNGATNVATPLILGMNIGLVAVNPVTNTIYVSYAGLIGNITALDGATNNQTTLNLGTGGSIVSALAVNPATNQVYAADTYSDDVIVIDGANRAALPVPIGNSPTALAIDSASNRIYTANGGVNTTTVIDGNTATASTFTTDAVTAADSIAVNPITHLVYIASAASRQLTVASGDTNSVTTVNTGNGPAAIVADRVTNQIFVPNATDGTLTVINGADNQTKTLTLPLTPGPAAMNSITGVLYSGDGDGAILAINAVTGATTVLQGEAPQNAVAVNETTNMVYFANEDGTIDVLNGQTQAITNLTGGISANAIAVNEPTNEIYVADTEGGLVIAIDGATNAASSISVGNAPQALAVNPVTNKVYVANTLDGTVSVIDASLNTATTTVTVGANPGAVAVNSLTNTIYVANEGNEGGGSVSVIDGSSDTVTTTVNLGGGAPAALAVNPATNQVYVANGNIGSLNIIDGATNVVSSIDAASPSSAIVVNPITGVGYALCPGSNIVEIVTATAPSSNLLATFITPLPGNATADQLTDIALNAASYYGPTPQPIEGIYYQVDTLTGPWLPALAGSSSAAGTAPLTDLTIGLHTLYAFAVDGQEATSIDAGPGSSLITGQVAAYTFVAQPSTFSFSSSSVLAHSSSSSVTVTVVRNFNAPATVNYQTFDGTAAAGSNYVSTQGALTFAQGQTTQTITVPLIPESLVQDTADFTLTLSTPSGTATVVSPNSLNVIIVNDSSADIGVSLLNASRPSTPGPATASLTVNITASDSSDVGQWRLFGQLYWQASGATITGLAAGTYEVEFQTVDGYTTPPLQVLAISTGQTATGSAEYFATGAQTMGALTVNIAPAGTGGWQLEGGGSSFNISGTTLTLDAGSYIIVFQAVSGFAAPSNLEAIVQAGEMTTLNVTYLVADSTTGQAPSLVPTSLLQTSPYEYLGQIQTDNGLGTGFVPLDHVVVTAAHVVFDDNSLSFVQGVQWFFEQETGVFETPAQIPQGFYVFSGYAAQREEDDTPGVSSTASQQLDVAALYFFEPTARGGQSGYMASNSSDNSWLTGTRNKLIAGYPVDVNFIPAANVGQLYATPIVQNALELVSGSLFKTTAITSYEGNSGGPLCVQFDEGTYYPAAIYLGGTDETVVRSIDSQVIDLMNRAEVAGNGGATTPGDGVELVSAGVSGTTAAVLGSLNVTLSPPAAVAAGAQWDLSNALHASGLADSGLAPGTYTISFTDVPGFATPSPQMVTVSAGAVATASASYTANESPTITSALTAAATVSVYFQYQIEATYDPTGYAIVSGALPAGLTLNTSTGLISGTPTAKGSFSVGLQASNSAPEPSNTATLAITVTPLGQLSVEISPAKAGSVPQKFAGTTIQSVGSTIKIMATPAAGYLFDHWSDADTGAFLSGSASYGFTMPQSLNLKATFVANAFLTAKGSYFALIQGGSYAESGVLQLAVTSAGSFTASFTLGGATTKVVNTFTNEGQYNGQIFLSTGLSFDVTLDLTSSGVLTGTLTNVNDKSQIILTTALPAAAPKSLIGSFTAQLPLASPGSGLPAGNGYGTITVAKSGSATFTGFLGDGAPVKVIGSLTGGSTWAFYFAKAQAKTAGAELVLGTLTPNITSPTGFTGTLDWFRQPNANDPLYKNGFATEIAFNAGAYKAPAVNYTTANVTLSGGNLGAAMVVPIDISSKNVVTAPSGPTGFTLRFTAATGLFSGIFLEGTVKHAFNGALLQAQSNGKGFFQESTGQTGSVVIQGP